MATGLPSGHPVNCAENTTNHYATFIYYINVIIIIATETYNIAEVSYIYSERYLQGVPIVIFALKMIQ